ncbi:MAG: tetratricopeptide repeat protein [Candidatus Odinarchaeota archaeon]
MPTSIASVFEKAKKLARSGQYSDAENLLSKLAPKVTDDKLLILIEIEQTRIRVNKGISSEDEINKLIERSKSINFDKGLAEALYLASHFYIMTKKYTKALEILKNSPLLDLYSKLADMRGLGNFFVSKSIISLIQEDLLASTNEINTAMRLFRQADDINGIISCYLILGRIEERKGDKMEAITHFRAALTKSYTAGNKAAIKESSKFLERLSKQVPSREE